MCFDHDSHPPIDPINGGALDAGRISLTSEDEDRAPFFGYLARPAQPTGAGIVILPDVRGCHPYFEELALRFAEHGIVALAIDYFGRTAGDDERGEDFDHMPHVVGARWSNLEGDIRAAVKYLRALDPAPRSVFTTGFCMGGRLAYLSATLGLDLAGVIGFYGWPTGPSRNGTPAPADMATAIAAPVLAIWGGADRGITPDIVETFEAALVAANVEHRSITYPGAPHSFFDRSADEHAEASAAAWHEVLGFIREHSA